MSDDNTDPVKLTEELNAEKHMRMRVEREAAQFQEAEIERLFWKDIAQRAQSKKTSTKANPELLEATRKVRDMSSRIQELLENIERRDQHIAKLTARISEVPNEAAPLSKDIIFDLQADLPGLDKDLPSYLGAPQTNKELREKLSKLRTEAEKRRVNNISLRETINELRKYKQNSVPRDMYKQKIDTLNEEIERRREYGKRLEGELAKRGKKKDLISKSIYNEKIEKLTEEIERRREYGKRLEGELAKRGKKKDLISKSIYNEKIEKLTEEIERRREYGKRLEGELQKRKDRESVLLEQQSRKNSVPKEIFDQKIAKLTEEINRRRAYNERIDRELAKRKATVESLREQLANGETVPQTASPSSHSGFEHDSQNYAALSPESFAQLSEANPEHVLLMQVERLKANNKKYLDEIAKQRDTIRWLRGEE